MRDIKFRSFNSVSNSFFYFNLNKGTEDFGFDYNAAMQYTGLKDKLNQNEVYEHDIIKHIEFGILKVEWDYQDTGWICLSKDYKKYKLVEVLFLGGIMVGNIHENKELLV